MYLLSLWLLFVLIFVNKVSVELCWTCPFASKSELIKIAEANYLPIACISMLLLSTPFYLYFSSLIKGAKSGPFEILEIEDKNAEHLVFLATYVIPLVGFGLENSRQIINLSITLVLLGAIYIRTNLFYANPTLSLLGFKIFNVKITGGSAILIAKEDLQLGDSVNLMDLDKRIFFAKKAIRVTP